LQTAVQARVDAGCPVGGTSAGEAILSSCGLRAPLLLCPHVPVPATARHCALLP
jgi:hypothetical protein